MAIHFICLGNAKNFWNSFYIGCHIARLTGRMEKRENKCYILHFNCFLWLRPKCTRTTLDNSRWLSPQLPAYLNLFLLLLFLSAGCQFGCRACKLHSSCSIDRSCPCIGRVAVVCVLSAFFLILWGIAPKLKVKNAFQVLKWWSANCISFTPDCVFQYVSPVSILISCKLLFFSSFPVYFDGRKFACKLPQKVGNKILWFPAYVG